MPSNDFKAFATGPGANVTSQATYAAAPTTTNGFSSGLAKSADMNKTLRQSSFIAAAVAQFTADNQAGNVVDDGVVGNFEAQLLAAIQAATTLLFTGANQQVGQTGFQKLPGGLILQFGYTTTPVFGNATGSITYPVSFNTTYATFMQDFGSNTGVSAKWKATSQNTVGFTYSSVATDSTQNYTFFWLALGR